MNPPKHWRIGTLPGIAFALVALLMLALAVSARLGLPAWRRHMDVLLHGGAAEVSLVRGLGDDVNWHAGAVRDLLALDDEAQREQQIARLLASRERIAQAWGDLRSRLSAAQDLELFQQVQQARAGFTAAEDELLPLVRAADRDGARRVLLDVLRPRQLAYQKSVEALTRWQEQRMEAASEAAAAVMERVAMLALGVAALGIAVAMARWRH